VYDPLQSIATLRTLLSMQILHRHVEGVKAARRSIDTKLSVSLALKNLQQIWAIGCTLVLSPFTSSPLCPPSSAQTGLSSKLDALAYVFARILSESPHRSGARLLCPKTWRPELEAVRAF
jgi:hypothetical protein